MHRSAGRLRKPAGVYGRRRRKPGTRLMYPANLAGIPDAPGQLPSLGRGRLRDAPTLILESLVTHSLLKLMNRLHHSLIALLVALTTWSATAQTAYRVEDVPNVQLIDYTRFVSDPADSIDAADEAALNQRIGHLRDSLDVEIAVVVLPAIDGDTYGSAREFANKLFNTWGIGKKETNRGLLIQLITNEDNREITFEVGYGLEGQLTDGLCKLIQKRRMISL